MAAGRLPAPRRGLRRSRRRARLVHRRRPRLGRVPRDLPAPGRRRLAGDPLQQHGRQRAGLGLRARARAARTQRDADPQGSVRPGGDRVRGAADPPRPRARGARRRCRRPRAGVLPRPRLVRGDGAGSRALPAVRRGAARFPAGRRRVPVRARGRRARPGPRRPHPRPRHRHGVGGIARPVQRLAGRAGRARPGDARRDRARRARRPTRSTSSMPRPTAARCSTPPRRGRCAPCSAIAPCRWWRSRARSASPARPAAPGSRPRCCSRSAASRRPRSVCATRGPDTPPGARSEAQPVGGRRALVLSVGSGGTVVAVVVEAA